MQFDAQDKIDLQTDEKLNQFNSDGDFNAAAASQAQAPPHIPAVSSEDVDGDDGEGGAGGGKDGMDFSFVRPKKQKKVCIVEEDIKMTKDEIEIYNQMRDEAVLEN